MKVIYMACTLIVLMDSDPKRFNYIARNSIEVIKDGEVKYLILNEN